MPINMATTQENISAFPLPTPAESPAVDVVIFDGHCRFCRANVELFHRLDRRRRLAFLSLHDPEVYRRWPDLTHEQLMQEMVIVDRHGGRHAGAASIRYLSRRLPLLWPLAPLLHIPFSMPLWRGLYRFIARNRYRIAGKRKECDDNACSAHLK
jgi:predicted DCC family thiol-disulfide oxidoreductase YuxK